MSQFVWIDASLALTIRDAQIAEHGGAAGVRDLGLLELALARPLNMAAYENPDAFDLAASYAFAIARNHPFADGNKRTALVVCELFLDLNDYELQADDAACVVTFLALAAGELEEDALANWLRQNSSERA